MVDSEELNIPTPFQRMQEIKREPQIHSHITDCLSDLHPLAWRAVMCSTCSTSLHVGNECMTTWIETGHGSFCVPCFASLLMEEDQVLEEDWGL